MGTYYPTIHRKASNPFSRLIRQAKEGDRESLDLLCSLIGGFLASTIGTLLPIDLILHVPTDAQRVKERGFSIPEALATAVSRRLGLPVSDCLVLTRPVRSVRGLPPEERSAELTDAFALSNAALIEKKCILLVDDVLGYGTTTAEIARLLRAQGAKAISIAVVAYAART
jgi:predicted amidophosphoribosyltransferase